MVSCSAESDLQSVRESIISISDPWDSTNSEIAKFEPALPQSNPDEEELLEKFPAPQVSTLDEWLGLFENPIPVPNKDLRRVNGDWYGSLFLHHLCLLLYVIQCAKNHIVGVSLCTN